MVEDAKRRHEDGLQRLEEARAFSAWSESQRESKLPKLTEEQQEQLQQYLRLVEEHGWNRSMEASEKGKGECVGCPVVMNFGKQSRKNNATAESSETD